VLYWCAAAVEIAVDLMWQDDFTHPLCRALSWHACHLRLSELLASSSATDESQAPAAATATAAAAAAAAAADDEEVTYCHTD